MCLACCNLARNGSSGAKSMMVISIPVVVLAMLLVLPVLSIAASEIQEENPCRVFLAPSSIQGAGLGVFVGRQSYHAGDLIGEPGDIIIPIIDFEWNNMFRQKAPFLFKDYTWVAGIAQGVAEEGNRVFVKQLPAVANLGIGAMANGNLELFQIKLGPSKLQRAINDSSSPGVGAISPYYNVGFQVHRPLNSGSEIFLEYGKNYFLFRKKLFGNIPTANDFIEADGLILQVKRLETRLKMMVERRRNDQKKLFYRISKTIRKIAGGKHPSGVGLNATDLFDDLWKLITPSLADLWANSAILRVLPSNRTEAYMITSSGGTKYRDSSRRVRDVGWLEEHGQCLDNIKFKNASLIPGAGRGAFATRFIPAGQLVAPAPLIHIPNRDVLKMYRPTEGNATHPTIPDVDGPFTYQLITNYCFGHEKSSLLLCPCGMSTAYINHSSKQANVKIQWNPKMRHPEWLDWPIDEWGATMHSGLALDIVALRDIDKDEEILMDYGSTWERAWEDHVNRFTPRTSYIPAYELNERVDLIYRTVNDERPYELDGVRLSCRSWFLDKYGGSRATHGGMASKCQILQHLGNDRYTVQLLDYVESTVTGKTTITPGQVVVGVPSSAFFFRDLPDARDHLQFDAFRHPMMLPDDVFPKIWQNQKLVSVI